MKCHDALNIVVFRMPALNPSRKTQILQAAACPKLADAVRIAAERELTTVSEFTRRALIERLQWWHGIDPATPRSER
jgi:hypothetical protein